MTPVLLARFALISAGLVYGPLVAFRIALALRFFARHRSASGEAGDHQVTVMQAILSGDPTLGRNLAENLEHLPEAHFLWLIDEDDAVARELAGRLQAEHPGRVRTLLSPPPPQGRNPKVFKLARGFPLVTTPLLAVLDDDTVLPAGGLARARGALAAGDLVTGLPCYRVEGSFFSRLVAAFVNANALVTYLPILAFRPPVTLNGMFYLTPKATLERLGGFAAIEDRLCDDYELAKLYRAAGLVLVQSTIVHPISTTVRGAADYHRILRRWMVFANQLFREALDPLMIVLVVLPAVLPLVLIVLASCAGGWALAATFAGLVAKAVTMAAVRHRLLDSRETLGGVLLEVLADLLQPLHAVTALFRPRQVRWRSRSIVVEDGGVRYR